MEYDKLIKKVKSQYNKTYSKAYRKSDNLAVLSEDHRRRCKILQSITTSFNYKISVLDIGCGTGRYFHCLKNVKNLIGIDISPFMIEEAKTPVLQEEIAIDNIELRCADIFDIELPECSFDFIYSIGVLGEHSPFNEFICNKVYKLLKKGGSILFYCGRHRFKITGEK